MKRTTVRGTRSRPALPAPAVGLLALAAAACLLAALSCGRPAPWDSVVLVVVDTLRADHLGLYGHERPTSPELDRWSRRAVVFEHAQAPSPWTLPTFGSLFTGELPSTHLAGSFSFVAGRKEHWSLAPGLPTLAELTAAGGMATGAVISNPFLAPEFGLDRGFETYDYHPSGNHSIRPADEVVDRALEWLDGRDGAPFFLVVHLFDPHLDYDAPAPHRGRFTGETEGSRRFDLEEIRGRLRAGEPVDMEFLAAAYDEEIAFVDAQVGRFLEALEGRGALDRALVLLTSDHGEELGDHGGFEHGHTMYQELLHVPLLAWGPGVVPRRVDGPVSLLDVFPTIVDGLGLGGGEGPPGISLLEVLAGAAPPTGRLLAAERPLYGPPEHAVVDWPWKLVVGIDDGSTRLYDLAADPGERLDLSDREPGIVERLAAVLAQIEAGAAEAPHGVELDPETRQRLRSLGYIR